MFGRRSKKLPATVSTGFSLLQGGDRDGALRAFAEASHTSDPNVLRALGAAYQQAGEGGYAEHCLRLAAQGGSRDALNDLGVLLKKQNRIEEAEQAFRQASDLGCANASNNLGNIWEMRGDLQAAAWYWHRAAEGGIPRAMVSLGIFLATTGQQADARIFYDRARAVLPQAPEIRDQLDLLGNMLSGQAQGVPGQGVPVSGGPVPGTQNDPFGPTVGRISAGSPAAGPAAGGIAPGGPAPGGRAPGGAAAGEFGTGAVPNADAPLTRMDTALTRKRPVPDESSPSQPASGEYAPTMISRSMPGIPATSDAGSAGGGGAPVAGADEIDTATVRNPRFRPREDTPPAAEVTDGELRDEAPVAEVGPPAPWDLEDSAVRDSAARDSAARDSATRDSATRDSAQPTTAAPTTAAPPWTQRRPCPLPLRSVPLRSVPLRSVPLRGLPPRGRRRLRPGRRPWPSGQLPSGPLPSGTWATESRRELRGEEPPTSYHRRLPTFSPADLAAAAGDEGADAAAPESAAAAFDLSDNLRTVEKLRASYLDTRNATTLRLALEINKVGVESAPADDPTAQALALSLRCTLLRLAYERDRNEAGSPRRSRRAAWPSRCSRRRTRAFPGH